MIIIATLVVALAAVFHVVIFVLESVLWSRPGVWKRFGVADQASADATRPLAYNQGFYNLFLAIGVFVGIVVYGLGESAVGLTLMLFCLSCMVLAAVVLVTTGGRFLGAALLQGMTPLAGIALLLLSNPFPA